ncbi:MAG TPA: large conductance mechanosensitive channel protein MscL [Vicinamibacterales bacterium]|nr:large conductance mechanosensitive channel protein MscL [Vicinamibacterales bacterium]
MLKEFRDFAARGNVIDLAVGIIIGAAFGKIVTSAVNDLIMPPIGMALGRVDFSNLFAALNGVTYASLDEAKKAGAPTLNYGIFLNTCLEFVIVAFAVFLLVKQVNRLKGPVVIDTRDCPYCYSKMAMKATRCPACTSEVNVAKA